MDVLIEKERILRESNIRLSEQLSHLQKESKGKIQELEFLLQESNKRRDAFESELTLFKNQDRAIREKCNQLEI